MNSTPSTIVRFVLGFGVLFSLQTSLLADKVTLNHGGVVRGLLEEDEEVVQSDLNENTEIILIRTLLGSRLSIATEQISDINHRPIVFEEYEVKAAQTAVEANAQWDMAEWCRERELFEQWKHHLEQVLQLNPDHLLAAKSITRADISIKKQQREELMQSRGMVKHKGRYVSKREKELLDKLAENKDNRRVWWKKVKLWHGWLSHRSPAFNSKGIAALRSIDTVDALPALEKYLQNEQSENYRLLFVEILPNIPDQSAVLKLVELSLFDESYQVRTNAFNQLPETELEFAASQYVRQLLHTNNQIVKRSAAILGEIGDSRFIPYLIDALNTKHTYQVRVQDTSNTYSVGQAAPVLPPQIEYQLRTGQLPYGVIVDNSNITSKIPTKVIKVVREHQNSPVLSALKAISDQNFGYNEVQWHAWWNSVRNGKATLPASKQTS